jgi:hypothetical protein
MAARSVAFSATSQNGSPRARRQHAIEVLGVHSTGQVVLLASSQRKNGIVVRMPSTSYSRSARPRREMAWSRLTPQAISFEISGS